MDHIILESHDETQMSGSEPPKTLMKHRTLLSTLRATFLHPTMGASIFYVALLIFFGITASGFASFSNLNVVLSGASIILIVSLGQTLAVISGGFDLSIGGVVPLGAVAYAEFLQYRLPTAIAMVLVVLVGMAVGAVNGATIKFGINPLIATLATMSIAGGIAYMWSAGVTLGISASAGFLGNNGPFGLPYYFYVAVGLAVLIHLILRRTVLGRKLYVVGGNAEAARLAGISIGLVRLSAYLFSGGLAAIAGIIYASQLLGASGEIGSTTALTSLAAVILGGAALTGGTGGVPGTLLGVLILGTVGDGLSIMRVSPFFEEIVSGFVLLVAVTMSRAQLYMTARPTTRKSIIPQLPQNNKGS